MHSASHELSMAFITIIPECFEKACGDFYKHTPQKEGGSVCCTQFFHPILSVQARVVLSPFLKIS